MLKNLKNYSLSAILLLLLFVSCTGPAAAQLLHVDSDYRIVSVDTAQERIGVALPNASPNVRQNWLYVGPDTRGSLRQYLGNGTFRDREIRGEQIISAAEHHRGDLLKVYGGRDWDGSIDAHTVWL